MFNDVSHCGSKYNCWGWEACRWTEMCNGAFKPLRAVYLFRFQCWCPRSCVYFCSEIQQVQSQNQLSKDCMGGSNHGLNWTLMEAFHNRCIIGSGLGKNLLDQLIIHGFDGCEYSYGMNLK